ncbi:MAG: FAD:protein FMN transferase [Candidatus Limnocylindria bacterium]|jgi:thiamine biosynthesis lipoprotein
MLARKLGFKAMGSPCELHLHAESQAGFERVAEAACAELARLERKYSRYLDDSLASRINASAGDPNGIELDEETASLLDYAGLAWEQSGGLFDITSGVLRRAWDFRSGRLPAPGEIDALRPLVGWEKIRWRRPHLVLPHAGMQLDFGGYVKEYAADRVAALCRELGLRHGLVDLGGDIAAIGPHPDGSPWRVGIRHPRAPDGAIASVALSAGGIATSGDYERCLVVDGKRYAHILNPKTGWPVSGLASVTVAASHCLIAGTASTIAMLKGACGGPAWLDRLGLPNLRIDAEGALSGPLAPPLRRRPAPPHRSAPEAPAGG